MVPIMKKISTALVAALVIAPLCGNAHADWERGRWPAPNQHIQHGHGHNRDWVAPLVFLGVAGAMISAANSQPRPQAVVYASPPVTYVVPETRYVAPQVVPAPAPANALYYCQSVGRYFPNTQYCPEGWQLVAQ